MKKVILLACLAILVTVSKAQTGFGFGLGYATSKSAMINAKYFMGENGFSLGGTYQSNNSLGKKVPDPIPGANIGDGDFYFSVDAGYTRVLSENFSVAGEISVGRRSSYINFSDNSDEGGVHTITGKKSVVGVGGFVIYNISQMFGFFAGYNSLREATFGVEVKFVH